MSSFKPHLIAIKKYARQRWDNRHSNLRFYNFWGKKNGEEYWLESFVKYHSLIPEHKKVSFISVFGYREVVDYINGPKIFYTGENVNSKDQMSHHNVYADHLKGKVHLALGFENTVIHNNYLRFPFWLMRLFRYDSTSEDIKAVVEQFNASSTRSLIGRDGFACNVSSHDASGNRIKIINLLKGLGEVDCAGAFMNNTNDLKEKFQDDKSLFLKHYKFNICPENSNTSGYVTEKIFDAVGSGCIPVYWGSKGNPEPNILNKDAMLFYDEKNEELLYDQIESLLKSEANYLKFIHIPPFDQQAPKVIWQMFEDLKSSVKKVATNF